MKKLKLTELLEGIEDTRRTRSVMYPLTEVLFIMLVAILCGATSYVKIEMFGKQREEWFQKYLKLENGVPDALTYRRVLMMITPEKMHQLFAAWMKTVIFNLKGVIALDGKQARRTGDDEKRPLHVVSAFAHEFGVVLGQIACEEKRNEIAAIPKLLELLEIKGCIVTIDAMGTQKEIAKKIREKQADYILALKENQGNLYRDVKLFMEEYCQDAEVKKGEHYAYSLNKEHGRFERRECYTYEDIGWLDGKEKWVDLNGIGMIVATIEKDGIKTVQHHFFIYSCKGMTARQIMDAKRAHWGIENSLHWVLDLSFREDESRIRKDYSAENFNILRQTVYNILKLDTSFHASIPSKQFRCMLDSEYLEHLLRTFVCS